MLHDDMAAISEIEEFLYSVWLRSCRFADFFYVHHAIEIKPISRLLILHFKFTKSIKSSTFHIFLNLTYPLRKNISFPKCPKITQKFTQNRQTEVNEMSREIQCRLEGGTRRQRGRVVSASDSQSRGPGFESRSGH